MELLTLPDKSFVTYEQTAKKETSKRDSDAVTGVITTYRNTRILKQTHMNFLGPIIEQVHVFSKCSALSFLSETVTRPLWLQRSFSDARQFVVPGRIVGVRPHFVPFLHRQSLLFQFSPRVPIVHNAKETLFDYMKTVNF